MAISDYSSEVKKYMHKWLNGDVIVICGREAEKSTVHAICPIMFQPSHLFHHMTVSGEFCVPICDLLHRLLRHIMF